MKVKIHKKAEQHSNHKHYSEVSEVVEANVEKENKKTVWVRLPDNQIIKRKKIRDVVE